MDCPSQSLGPELALRSVSEDYISTVARMVNLVLFTFEIDWQKFFYWLHFPTNRLSQWLFPRADFSLFMDLFMKIVSTPENEKVS